MAMRAYQKRAQLGRCPSCGKKGLGGIIVNVWSKKAVRECRYCCATVDAEKADQEESRAREILSGIASLRSQIAELEGELWDIRERSRRQAASTPNDEATDGPLTHSSTPNDE